MIEPLFWIALIAFFLWLFYRFTQGIERGLVHESLYALSILSAISTYSYFIDIELDNSIKFLVSIIGGFILLIAGVLVSQHGENAEKVESPVRSPSPEPGEEVERNTPET